MVGTGVRVLPHVDVDQDLPTEHRAVQCQPVGCQGTEPLRRREMRAVEAGGPELRSVEAGDTRETRAGELYLSGEFRLVEEGITLKLCFAEISFRKIGPKKGCYTLETYFHEIGIVIFEARAMKRGFILELGPTEAWLAPEARAVEPGLSRELGPVESSATHEPCLEERCLAAETRRPKPCSALQ